MLITDESLNHDKTYELIGLQISDCSNGMPMQQLQLNIMMK